MAHSRMGDNTQEDIAWADQGVAGKRKMVRRYLETESIQYQRRIELNVPPNMYWWNRTEEMEITNGSEMEGEVETERTKTETETETMSETERKEHQQ